MPLALRTIAHSEIGLVRKTNQDSGYVSGSMLLVADGMGGAAAGDLASAVVARQLCHADDHPAAGEQALDVLRDHTTAANAALAELVAANPELDGMGTTVCGAIFDGTALNIVHIGDSRGYLMRDGKLRRLTHDHSYVQSLIDDGRLDERQAMTHPHRSLLLKVLNGQPDAAPDYFSAEVAAGDRIMFCSDGLCGMVGDSEIQAVLKLWDLGQAMETLVELAYAAGGTDNITIVLADVVDDQAGTTPALIETTLDQDGPTPDVPAGTTGESGQPDQADSDQPDETGEQPTPGETGQTGETAETSKTGEAAPGEQTMLMSPLDRPEPPAEHTLPLPLASSAATQYATTGLLGAAADPDIIALLDKMAPHAKPAEQVPHVAAEPPKNRTRLSAADQERQRYTPVARKRRGWIWIIVAAIVVVLVGAGFGVYEYGTHQYYIGDDNGQVAIYQGLPGTIAGIETSRLYQTTSVSMANLPLSWRAKVSANITITSGGLAQAQATVEQLDEKAQQCLSNRAARAPTDPVPQDGC